LKGLAALLPQGSCAVIGKVGRDKMGKLYSDIIAQRGVIPILSISDHTPTGECICLITPDGERTMRTFLGASSDMLVGDLLIEDFHDIKLYHVEGYGVYHKDLTLKSLKYAKQQDALISYDLGSFEIVKNYRLDFIRF
jgi:sugar/nucleoside kinase (ribokinase family)